MRFLNTHTLQFETVADSELDQDENRYAILSHRWGNDEDEVSFADVRSQDFSHRKAFPKLKGFCDLAASLGYRYGWLDTCCIDKTNLVELSEAIASMYRWYQASDVCIVYLVDVPKVDIMDSSWWSRGWTLQELIGPESASFYDCHWRGLGTKIELLSPISNKTEIPEDVLSHKTSPAVCSIAQRMSWAAIRETTRVEDRAYSLLGIFGVHMPIIYGEKENAFQRLQKAIIDNSKDESIFAWAMGIGNDKRKSSGLLAPSPSSYVDCGDIVSVRGSSGFNVINGELGINLRTFPHSMETYFAALNCTRRTHPDDRISIMISRLSTDDEYVRVNKTYVGARVLMEPQSLREFEAREIYVSLDPKESPMNRVYGFWLRTIEPPGHTDCRTRVLSRRSSPEEDKVLLYDKDWGTAGVVSLEPKVKPDPGSIYRLKRKGWSRIRWIELGFDDDFNPMLLLANDNSSRYNYDDAQQLWLKEEWFEQATASEEWSQARNKIFNNRWITSAASVPSRVHGWSTGTSILKVDKKTGISTSLKALNLGISVQLAPDRSPYVNSRGSADEDERQIWVVEITDADGNDPEWDLDKFDECMECLVSRCDDSDLRSTNAVASQAWSAHRQSRVLTASDLERLN